MPRAQCIQHIKLVLLALVVIVNVSLAMEAEPASAPALNEVEARITNKLTSMLGMDSVDSINVNDELGLGDIQKKRQEETNKAQQKAYLDGYMNAYNQFRFQQMAQMEAAKRRRHRRHMREKKEAAAAAAAATASLTTTLTDTSATTDSTTNAPLTTSTSSPASFISTSSSTTKNTDSTASQKHKHRQSSRRTKHRRHRHTLNSYPNQSTDTYFQQYYAHPRFSAYYPYWNSFHHHHHHHHHNHQKEVQQKALQQKIQQQAAQARFREQIKVAEKKEQSLWSYGDSFNAQPLDDSQQRITSSNTPVGGYSPPMNIQEPMVGNNNNMNMNNAPIMSASISTAMPMPSNGFHPLGATPINSANNNNFASLMRFAQTQQTRGGAGMGMNMGMGMGMNMGNNNAGNEVNPTGIPMPFYPPTAPPPPAPNQVPTSPALVNSIYPQQLEMPTSQSMPMAGAGMTQPSGLNPAAQVMMPHEPPASVNNYPFSSFIETSSSSSSSSNLPSNNNNNNDLIHPQVYRLAQQYGYVTPLIKEHMELFPELK